MATETHSGGCIPGHNILQGEMSGVVYVPAMRPLQFLREVKRSMVSFAS